MKSRSYLFQCSMHACIPDFYDALPCTFIRVNARDNSDDVSLPAPHRPGFNLMHLSRAQFSVRIRGAQTRRRRAAAAGTMCAMHLYGGRRARRVVGASIYSCIPSRHNLLTSTHTYVSHQHAYNIRVINVWLPVRISFRWRAAHAGERACSASTFPSRFPSFPFSPFRV